jgi:hypothetical protein
MRTWIVLGGPLALAACIQMLGEEHTVVGDDRECDTDDDCGHDEGCDDDDNVCRKKCFDDAACGPFRTCAIRFCSDPVGTPCDPDDYLSPDCYGTYNCESVDSANEEVLGYCTITCYNDMPNACPVGYACIGSDCLVNH